MFFLVPALWCYITWKFKGGSPAGWTHRGDAWYTSPTSPPTLKIPKAHTPGVLPPNLTTGGRWIVYFPLGTCCPGVEMSSFLCNKLDILICSYIYLGSILHFYMPAHVISGKIHAKLYALIRQTSEFVHVLLRSLAGGWGLFSTISLILVIIFHNGCRKSLLYLRLSTD